MARRARVSESSEPGHGRDIRSVPWRRRRQAPRGRGRSLGVPGRNRKERGWHERGLGSKPLRAVASELAGAELRLSEECARCLHHLHRTGTPVAEFRVSRFFPSCMARVMPTVATDSHARTRQARHATYNGGLNDLTTCIGVGVTLLHKL